MAKYGETQGPRGTGRKKRVHGETDDDETTDAAFERIMAEVAVDEAADREQQARASDLALRLRSQPHPPSAGEHAGSSTTEDKPAVDGHARSAIDGHARSAAAAAAVDTATQAAAATAVDGHVAQG